MIKKIIFSVILLQCTQSTTAHHPSPSQEIHTTMNLENIPEQEHDKEYDELDRLADQHAPDYQEEQPNALKRCVKSCLGYILIHYIAVHHYCKKNWNKIKKFIAHYGTENQ